MDLLDIAKCMKCAERKVFHLMSHIKLMLTTLQIEGSDALWCERCEDDEYETDNSMHEGDHESLPAVTATEYSRLKRKSSRDLTSPFKKQKTHIIRDHRDTCSRDLTNVSGNLTSVVQSIEASHQQQDSQRHLSGNFQSALRIHRQHNSPKVNQVTIGSRVTYEFILHQPGVRFECSLFEAGPPSIEIRNDLSHLEWKDCRLHELLIDLSLGASKSNTFKLPCDDQQYCTM